MTFINYPNLEIYHLAHQFVLETYKLVQLFPSFEDNNLTSQLRRAATCLPLNIAEGSGARSNKIFLNYCIFCYRSCLETQAALALARDLNYITKEQHDSHAAKLDTFIRKLYKYMQYLEGTIGNRKEDKTMWYRHEKWKMEQNLQTREGMGKLC
ncbi:MAG TPA: four helix bundle protein [Candidatus Nanoarchaeia archaeon]|nr:four helix bundle protein [Candidatus Nanoarchaeia archaeon]